MADEALRVGIVGCGTMGQCLLSAILSEAVSVRASVRSQESLARLQRLPLCAEAAGRVEFTTCNYRVCEWASIVIIGYGACCRCWCR